MLCEGWSVQQAALRPQFAPSSSASGDLYVLWLGLKLQCTFPLVVPEYGVIHLATMHSNLYRHFH